MKTVGVIKATYNQAIYASDVLKNIEECLNGFIYFYIRDDCSTDNTYETLAAGEGRFVKVARNSSNVGVRENSKRLLRDCQADYVAFSGGDDFVSPAAVRDLMTLINDEAPDMVLMKVLRVPVEKALAASRLPDGSFDKSHNNPLVKNGGVFSKRWSNINELLDASAVMPGYVWLQGAVIKKEIAAEAGYLKSGSVDDWGLLHNIAVLNKARPLNCVLLDRVFGVVGDTPNSLGSQINKQFSRQIQAVHTLWDPSYQKVALLNVVEKKISAFRGTDMSYRDMVETFKATFENLEL